ncbi:MAG TPA: lipid II flippase MurJ [Victivallales bacterium]|nr:lipid II flippase MurJ [Victivallales bacterium]
MNLLKRTSTITIFLIIILILKSALSILLRTLIVSHFGAGTETDAYFAAFSIPQQLSDFFIGGILFAAIIPVFQKRRVEVGNEISALEMAGFINISSFILILSSILYLIFTPYIIRIIFSGFEIQKQKLTITYARLFSPLIFLFGLSLIYSSLYHSFRNFFIPALSTLMYPLCSIISLYFLSSTLGIERLVYGNLMGSMLGITILVVFINKKVPLKWFFQYRTPLISSIFNISLPVLIENLFLKLAIFIRNRIISILPINGALTMIELNLFIIHSIGAFISGPITTAIFPLLGEQEAQKTRNDLIASFQKTFSIIFLFAVPSNVFIFLGAESLVKILFGHGKFSEFECETTARLIIITSFVILPNSIQSLVGRMFFILQYTKIPAIISSILVMVGAIICYFAAIRYGIYGFMIAATIGTSIGCLCNFILLIRKLHLSLNYHFFSPLIKSIFAGLLMAGVLFSIEAIYKFKAQSELIYLIIMAITGTLAYFIFCIILKHEDLKYLMEIPFKKINK